jgi:hypothetical protein
MHFFMTLLYVSTKQMYLGKISDTEAMKWIENLYA